MQRNIRITCLLCALVLVLGMPTSGLAQAGTDSVTISVPVLEETGILTVSGQVSLINVPAIYLSVGGTVTGTLNVSVFDSRLGDNGWYVLGSVSRFSNGESPPSMFPANIPLVLQSPFPLNEVTGYDAVLEGSTGGSSVPPVLLLEGMMTSQPLGWGDWSLSFAVPAGLVSGNYTATVGLDVYAGDPP